MKPRMSDAAVQAKTGKTWDQWFALLDAAGAGKMNHQAIVAHLRNKHGVGPWWQQMVAVTYEQVRGLREKHQKPSGFQISVSRTLPVSVAAAFRTWSRCLAEKPVTIRKAIAGKSLRITWRDGKTSVEVRFYPKGTAKSQVAVEHGKLPDARAAERMKKWWGKVLDRYARDPSQLVI